MSIALASVPEIPELSEALKAQLPVLLARLEQFKRLSDVDEWRAKASALEEYLAKRKLDFKPAQHLARMTEIRLGELLPPPRPGERTDLQPFSREKEVVLDLNELHRFRLMAFYRQLIEPMLPTSRRKLLKAIAEIQEAERAKKMRIEGHPWTLTGIQESIACAAIITDPPYGILNQDWEPSELEHFTRDWLARWNDTGADFLFSFFSQRWMWRAREWFDSELSNYNFQQLLIWHYANNKSPQSRLGFKQTWEPIFFYRHKESAKEIKLKRGGKNWGKGINDFDCHVAAVPQSNFNGADRKVHPSQKPVSVFTWLIAASTSEGEIVADPFAGVATSGIAAVRLKRLWHGIETNSGYLANGQRRLRTYGTR